MRASLVTIVSPSSARFTHLSKGIDRGSRALGGRATVRPALYEQAQGRAVWRGSTSSRKIEAVSGYHALFATSLMISILSIVSIHVCLPDHAPRTSHLGPRTSILRI